MTEPEDRDLSARYRALPDEAPSAALDAAVLDAARRDVRMRPASGFRRWTLPVSLAAVVMLSVLVTLRIEDERPDVAALRESTGLASPAEEKAAEPGPAPTPKKGSDPISARPAVRPPKVSQPTPVPAQRAETGVAEKKGSDPFLAPAAPASSAGMRAAPEAASPARGSGATTDSASTQGEVRLKRDRADANRAKSEAPASAESAARMQDAAPELPRAWLERIVRLRREGRTAEADKALEAFRGRHPGYEIPEALREAVLGAR